MELDAFDFSININKSQIYEHIRYYTMSRIASKIAETNKKEAMEIYYEHKMHDVKYQSSGTGTTSLFDIEFNVNNQYIKIYVGELIDLIKEVNILFSKIVQEISTYAYENKKEDYAYYERICRFDFKDFNEIYECNILRKIGKVMNEF